MSNDKKTPPPRPQPQPQRERTGDRIISNTPIPKRDGVVQTKPNPPKK